MQSDAFLFWVNFVVLIFVTRLFASLCLSCKHLLSTPSVLCQIHTLSRIGIKAREGRLAFTMYFLDFCENREDGEVRL